MDPRAHWYERDGLRVRALEWGSRGAPLVLLHGAGGNALWWAPLATALDGRRVIALDLPGHGESPGATSWDLPAHAEALFALVDEALDGNTALWGGHSWGGKLAAIVGATHPAHVRGLVLVDPSPAHGFPIPPADFIDAALGGERGPWPSLEAAAAAVRSLPQYRHWTPALGAAFARGLSRRPDGSVAARASRDDLIAIAQAALGEDHSAIIAAVSGPTLLIIAEESIPWQDPTNGVALPAAARVVIPQANHWIHADQPAALHEAVRRWLAVHG